MKKNLLLVLFLTLITGLIAQTDFFYSADGKIESFKIRKDILVLKHPSESDLESIFSTNVFNSVCVFDNSLIIASLDSLTHSIETLQQIPGINDVTYALEYKDGVIQMPTYDIFLRLKEKCNPEEIFNKAGFARNISDMKLLDENNNIYFCTMSVSLCDMLQVCRNLYETEDCIFVEPNFIRQWKPHIDPTTNPYYQKQWGLNNSDTILCGDSVDIRAEETWTLTTGSPYIKTAVLDEGVQLDHPDLAANLLPGFDATWPGGNGGYTMNDDHGTRCSGIIGAVHNDIGIIGVAPYCKIVPVKVGGTSLSRDLEDPQWTSDDCLIEGIQFAWKTTKADILSCSWGGGSPSTQVNNAIDSAVTRGRNGKGCIVVFSSGNREGGVSWPANLPNVISVGSIDMYGYKSGFSNYGVALDVVAPGEKIITTTLNSAIDTLFSGTSAACPHVSGIAALILSINPNLSRLEIKDIIEKTAWKVNDEDYYIYDSFPERPNGTWNNEMGYGLVDAHAAVIAALETRCYKENLPKVHGNIEENTIWNTPAYANGDIYIHNGATLTISSRIEFDQDVSITVKAGGKLIINGGTLTNACSGEFWQGITVLGDTKQPSAQYQGTVSIQNNGKIENAHCGITVEPRGLVYATHANFENNTVGVFLKPQAGEGAFKKTTFTLNDNYLGNLNDFETHIKAQNSSVSVIACNFSSVVPPSDNYKNTGISAFNSNVIVKEICPPGGSLYPNTSICADINTEKNNFSGFSKAITATNSGATTTFKVRHTNFSNNLYGVNINGINSPELILNDFLITLPNSFGIYLTNSTGYKIEENKLRDTLPIATKTTRGLWISNSGTPENEVYKNDFDKLYIGQQIRNKNSAQVDTLHTYPYIDTSIRVVNQITGLQMVCNKFTNSVCKDIYVGNLINPSNNLLHSIRKEQGSALKPAGNQFSQNFSKPFYNFESFSQHTIVYHHHQNSIEKPATFGRFTLYSTFNQNGCLSKIGNIGQPNKGEGNLENALAQYDEWNELYEYWLAKLLATEEGSEQYEEYLQMVSHYSALKDNYFNSIIVSVMDENVENGKQIAESGEKSPSNFEGVSEGRGSLYENLRFLFHYRNHYTDHLCIVETFLAENNFMDALSTIANLFKQFELSEDQMFELEGLQTYSLWLQQLDEKGINIYELPENEIEYLINYMKTHIGRGVVFVNNILCELHEICLDQSERMEIPHFVRNDDPYKSVQSVSSAYDKDLEKITIFPNPTTGELRVESEELRVNHVEIFDIYGRKCLSTQYTLLSTQYQ